MKKKKGKRLVFANQIFEFLASRFFFFSFLSGMFIMMISSRLGELLCHYRVYSSSCFIIHILCVLGHRYSRYPIMNRQSLPISPLFHSYPKNDKSIKSQWTRIES